MTRWVWGYLYWGLIWMFVGFLIPELLGEWRVSPWPTLSETVWHSERYPVVSGGVLALLVGLIAHFLYQRPLWACFVFGIAVAGFAHLADSHWP